MRKGNGRGRETEQEEDGEKKELGMMEERRWKKRWIEDKNRITDSLINKFNNEQFQLWTLYASLLLQWTEQEPEPEIIKDRYSYVYQLQSRDIFKLYNRTINCIQTYYQLQSIERDSMKLNITYNRTINQRRIRGGLGVRAPSPVRLETKEKKSYNPTSL